MLDPVHLVTLQAVLRTGSFAAAAAELQYTPSAVSQQMSSLERSCGIALFERLPRQAAPTAAARALGARSADILAGLRSAELEIATLARGEAGEVRIGCFPTAGARVLPRALAALATSHPDIDIHLDEGEPGDLEPAVLARDLDLALVYRYDLVPVEHAPGLLVTTLFAESLSILLPAAEDAHPPGARLRVNTLRERTWVAPLEGSAGAVNLDRLCALAGFSPRIAYRSNDYSVVRGLVGAGLGVAIVPGLALPEPDGNDPALQVHPVVGRQVGRRVLAVHRASDRNPLLAPVLAALQG